MFYVLNRGDTLVSREWLVSHISGCVTLILSVIDQLSKRVRIFRYRLAVLGASACLRTFEAMEDEMSAVVICSKQWLQWGSWWVGGQHRPYRAMIPDAGFSLWLPVEIRCQD